MTTKLSIKRLLCSLALILVGSIPIAFSICGWPKNHTLETIAIFAVLAVFLPAGALIGAGILNLWKQPKLGAIIGTVIWFVYVFIHWISTPPE